eukprot:CAMPEP_0181196908 /NCGR_PEP_ID=MMETSP1096-20121128/15734_1 /TAXON_ID=156174 ORGANISM="Chrysochromulina ericina, Strain CCMP281" /NCGR_SAMPLE_ID=MMETSP1096 /ASSEMBLY_ACC=CAM_ASM_000453 /LENGTH=454 /DNA_ID=CAMNT_0023286735 /DNA_START=12 /DNA_END=1373 /DNA_ORIENTATION=+
MDGHPIMPVSEAVDMLEGVVAKMSEGATHAKLQSTCNLMRSARRAAHVPEALMAPTTPDRSAPNGPELDVGVVLPPALPDEMGRRILDWDFNIHEIPAHELPALCFGAFLTHTEFHELGINKKRLWRFVQEIAARYRNNPFHSFRHAVDVTLCTSCLVRMVQRAHKDRVGQLSDPQVVVSLLVAAMFHDTDHPGVMNGYLIATRHPLAVLYNNQSVLENHHCSTAIALLERPELNFLAPLSKEQQTQMQKYMIQAVLATDVTGHMKFLKDVEDRLASDAPEKLDPSIVIQLIIKSADISNPTRALSVYTPWISGVMEEFFTQGDAERALGLPISMNCDRKTVQVAKCQVGFITFLVKPLFQGFSKYLPELEQIAMRNLDANLEHFKNLSALRSYRDRTEDWSRSRRDAAVAVLRCGRMGLRWAEMGRDGPRWAEMEAELSGGGGCGVWMGCGVW